MANKQWQTNNNRKQKEEAPQCRMRRISDKYLDNVANGKQSMATHTTIAGEMLLSVECPEIRCPESNTAQNAQKKPVRLALDTAEIETKSMPKTHLAGNNPQAGAPELR